MRNTKITVNVKVKIKLTVIKELKLTLIYNHLKD